MIVLAKQKYYAVKVGKETGIYKTWPECQKQVSGYPSAKYKSFDTLMEAEEYIGECKSFENVGVNQEDGVTILIGGAYQEETELNSYVILMNRDKKYRLEYGRVSDCEKDFKTFLGEMTGVVKTFEIAYELKDELKKATICHQNDEIRKWCIGETKPNTPLSKRLHEMYQDCIKFFQIEFSSIQSPEQQDQINQIAKYALDNDTLSIINNVHYHECNSHTTVALENIKGLNISPSKCIEIINETCKNLQIEMCIKNDIDVKTDKHIVINFNKNYLSSEIHIHTTKDGLTLDVIRGKNLELNFLIIKELDSKYNIGKVEEKKYSYANLTDDQLREVLDNLLMFKEDPNYEFTENKNVADHIKSSFTIKSKTSNEKVYIYIYTNNKLEIRGIKYLLWEDVCYIVEKSIGVTLNDIIGRMNVGVDLNFHIDEVDRCDEDLHKDLGDDLINFLYSYDYDVILSVKCSFDAKVKVRDYGIYIDPLAKAFEGYFKKVLLHMKIVQTEKEMNSPRWTLACVFEDDCTLKNDLHSLLNHDIIIRQKQINVLSSMCDFMWTIRNRINHSGPKGTITYNNYELGLLKYSQIIKLIKDSFKILF